MDFLLFDVSQVHNHVHEQKLERSFQSSICLCWKPFFLFYWDILHIKFSMLFTIDLPFFHRS